MFHRRVRLSMCITLSSVFILATLFKKEMFYSLTYTVLHATEPLRVDEQEETLETSGQKVSHGVEKESSSRKILCSQRPEYLKKANIQLKLDPGIVNSVEAMLMFVGYARSGHTLISSLLDAHPNIVVAIEYNILGQWENYTTEHRNKQYLFEELYKNSYVEAREGDRSSRKDCIQWTKYNYKVPNQWQGNFDGKVKIIGDKNAGLTANLLKSSRRYWSMLQNIEGEVRVPIKFLHVIRNPFDNIATAILRGPHLGLDLNWTELYRSPANIPKEEMMNGIHDHMQFSIANAKFFQAFGIKKVHTLRSEDVIANPQLELSKICEFLNVACSAKYLNDATSIVRRKISRSRNCVVWNKQAKDLVFKYLQEIPFYRGYQFDE